MIDKETLKEFSQHLKIIHHTRGRIRLRIDSDILQKFSSAEIESIIDTFKGVKEFRLNKLAASAVVHYDPDILPPDLWEKWIDGTDIEEVFKTINNLRE